MFIPQMKGYNNYAMCNSQYKKKEDKTTQSNTKAIMKKIKLTSLMFLHS